jgi:uncharacterized membrane protein YgcG
MSGISFRINAASIAVLSIMSTASLSWQSLADAKPMLCSARHTSCTERCIMGTNGDGGACIQRTCDRQFNNCMQESSGGGGGRGDDGGRGPRGGGGGGGSSGKSGSKTTGGPIVRDHRR